MFIKVTIKRPSKDQIVHINPAYITSIIPDFSIDSGYISLTGNEYYYCEKDEAQRVVDLLNTPAEPDTNFNSMTVRLKKDGGDMDLRFAAATKTFWSVMEGDTYPSLIHQTVNELVAIDTAMSKAYLEDLYRDLRGTVRSLEANAADEAAELFDEEEADEDDPHACPVCGEEYNIEMTDDGWQCGECEHVWTDFDDNTDNPGELVPPQESFIPSPPLNNDERFYFSED